MGTLKNKEISNNDVSMITYLVFAIFILLLIIGSCFIGISINSKKDTESIIGILNNVGGAIGGITSPMVGIIGALLVYLTFEQQRFLINKEIEKEQNKNNNIRNVIISDLKDIQYEELLLTKIEIEGFNLVKHDQSARKFIFRETISLSANFIDSIPIQDLYEAFSDKSEFHNVIYIYRKIKFIEKYALNNLFNVAMFDYSGQIDFNSILSKHDIMLNFIPNHIQVVCNMIQGLEYKPSIP